ncbi:hypothetical protein QBC32DRAFT_374740 [Pseudoneurospora amorphoporcata]|uniref:Uncharacterized protein n=1 Tax=Pseudoneurospora amorphoporcata TaxID=241081 RepID=A0AAN6SAS3_9PEZI|nr:hypothetical protein QBC32DRAFT_374740 [Pseudoneurospora amorphoporcata]
MPKGISTYLSILHYRNVLGRTYHSDFVTDGEYWGLNNAKANELLDIMHAAIVILFDGKLNFADDHPNYNVISTDISLIQPSWVPPNASFEINDASKKWTYQENYFDFIHIRWLTGIIKDWDFLYKEAYRCCEPGGWIEQLDCDVEFFCFDGTMPNESAIAQWGPIWKEVERKTGLDVNVVSSDSMDNGMKNAGFTNITSEDYYIRLSLSTRRWGALR